jgi:hypothetical protein
MSFRFAIQTPQVSSRRRPGLQRVFQTFFDKLLPNPLDRRSSS